MAEKFENNASTTLASSLSSTDTTATVANGTGDDFPAIDPADDSEFCFLTIEDATGSFEIVKCIGRIGDNFTIDRAEQDTLARAFSVGDRFEQRLTAETMNAFVQRGGDNIDGNTTQIQIQRTETAGGEPNALAKGELFIDITGGKLWYGDTLGQDELLIENTYVTATTTPPTSMKAGAIWYQTDTALLKIYDGSAWRDASVPTGGGNFNGHVTISAGGHVYFQTSTDLYFNGTNVRGVLIQDDLMVGQSLLISEGCIVGGGQIVWGDFGVGGAANFTGEVNIEGVLHMNSAIRRTNSGGYLFYDNANLWNAGRIYTSPTNAPPANSVGVNGDLWFGLE